LFHKGAYAIRVYGPGGSPGPLIIKTFTTKRRRAKVHQGVYYKKILGVLVPWCLGGCFHDTINGFQRTDSGSCSTVRGSMRTVVGPFETEGGLRGTGSGSIDTETGSWSTVYGLMRTECGSARTDNNPLSTYCGSIGTEGGPGRTDNGSTGTDYGAIETQYGHHCPIRGLTFWCPLVFWRLGGYSFSKETFFSAVRISYLIEKEQKDE
jgi:hypothetical protein